MSFVTTLPAPIVTLSPILTFSTTHTFGPIYTLLPITAALPQLDPTVTFCEIVQLSPIIADGLTKTGA